MGERDLSRTELWARSLERSLQRRRRSRRASLELWALRSPRDLADPEPTLDSLAFSRRRREAAERQAPLPASALRGLSLLGVLAATAGTAADALSTGAVAVAATAPTPAPTDSVSALQRALGVSADGVFGPQTEAAVRSFQQAHGMTVDGIVGPATRAALGLGAGPVLHPDGAHAATAHTASAHLASLSGGGVAGLQRALGLGADGVFGPQTEAAVRSFQQAHGMTVDGVVGPATRAALGLGAGPVLHQRGAGAHAASAGPPTAIAEMIAAGDQIATRPYVYGGGHGSFSSTGYDCSGSVSYVLHAAGLLSSPEDSSALEGYGAPGPGRYVTIYANAGHAYMTIDGRRFDTIALQETGTRWSSSAGDSSGYVERHPVGL